MDALLQIVRMTESGYTADRFLYPVVTRAFSILSADHLQDDRVAQACLQRTRFAGAAIEPYLRALLAKSQDREIRAYACLELARQSHAKLYHLDRIVAPPSDRPEHRACAQFCEWSPRSRIEETH